MYTHAGMIHMYPDTWTHIHINIHIRHTQKIHMHVNIYRHTCIYKHTEKHVCIYIHRHIYPNMHVGTCIQTYMYTCIGMHMYTLIHVHTCAPGHHPSKRNPALRPISESSNLAGAFVALVWEWLRRYTTPWSLFHWEIGIKWTINPLGPKVT